MVYWYVQIIKAYDQTYCIKKTPNLQICCVLFKHVYYVIDVTKKLQVLPVNKRYLAIDIHALILLNQTNQPCISLSQSVTSKQIKMYITLCILRYPLESPIFHLHKFASWKTKIVSKCVKPSFWNSKTLYLWSIFTRFSLDEIT